MTTNNMVKCIGCNVVISEILAFIQNQVDVMTEDNIVRLCVTAFSLEDVVAAKSLLYQSVKTSEKKIARKGKAEGRVQRDLQDIISLIKCTEAERMPIFVAKELRKLPPVTFDHIDVTRLLKDIIILKDQLEVIREQYATVDQVKQLRTELCMLRQASMISSLEPTNFVNNKRGARNPLAYRSIEADSGPFGILDISQCAPKNIENTAPEQEETADVHSSSPINRPSIPLSRPRAERFDALSPLSPVTVSDTGNSTLRASRRLEAATAVPTETGTLETNRCMRRVSTGGAGRDGAASEKSASVTHDAPNSGNYVSYSQRAREGGEFINQLDEQWKVVQRKKLRNQFIGTTGVAKDSSSKFKAADVKVPLFINNVDMQVSIKDINEYITSKTQVIVNLVEIKMKRQRRYKAYKVFVPRNKLSTFMDENLWPEGITFRRFVNVRANNFRNVGVNEATCTK